MDELSKVFSVVRILVSKDGNADKVTAKADKARHSGLKDRLLQQKLFGNVVAARLHAHDSELNIRQYDDAKDGKVSVEDLFLHLADELLPRILAQLITLRQQHAEKKKAETKSAPAGKAPELEPDAIGARDIGCLQGLLQFTVALGIHPFLKLQLRADAKNYTTPPSVKPEQPSVLANREKMMATVTSLRRLREHDGTAPLLRSDGVQCAVLCVLIELVIDTVTLPSSSGEAVAKDEPALVELREKAQSWLDELVESFLGPPLVSQLFYLQHVAQRSATIPNGCGAQFAANFQAECGRLLSKVAMASGCVKHIMAAVLATRNTDALGPELHKVLRLLAGVLSRRPQQSESALRYFDSVVKQLLELSRVEAAPQAVIRLGAVFALKTMSNSGATEVETAFQQHLFAPIRPLYDSEFAGDLPTLLVSSFGNVIVNREQLERCIKAIHTLTTVPTGGLHFRFSTQQPVLTLFCMAASMPSDSPLRKLIFEAVSCDVLQCDTPTERVLSFLDPSVASLAASVAFVPSKQYIVYASLSADDDSSLWRDELKESWPPAMPTINPAIVSITDVLVEFIEPSKTPTEAGVSSGTAAASAAATPAQSPMTEASWNRNGCGAKIVSGVLNKCLQDLTNSLDGNIQTKSPAAVASSEPRQFLEAGLDVDPEITRRLDGDFERLNLVATISERYGPGILPHSSSTLLDFAGQGLAAAAFILDPGKLNSAMLESVSEPNGQTRIVGHMNGWTINVFAAQIWSSVAIQLCLALLSHHLEMDVKFGDCEVVKRIVQSLQVIANHHDDQGIRDHCLEVQVAASTYITLACIADSSWATSGSGAAAAAGGDGEGADGVDSATAGLEQLLSSLQAGNLDAVSEQLGKRAAKAGKKNTAGKSTSAATAAKPKTAGITEVRAESSAAKPASSGGKQPSSSSPMSADLKQAFAELRDPLLPVQGHGLQLLGKLLQKRDRSALEHVDKLAEIFVEQLAHPDSYIYLAAVNGLVAIGNVKTSLVVPRLCQEFMNCRKQANARSADTRLVLCEAISKVARLCGALLPHYRQFFLNSLLAGSKDDDGFVRAAALSCLSDVVGLLRFSLESCLYEVTSCFCSVLQCDKEAKPRQAAALALKEMITGLGSEGLKITAQASTLMLRRLRAAASGDEDETVRRHCIDALDAIDTVVRAAFKPTSSGAGLTKKIQVLPSP
ncbi:uncharacterized protein LOC135825355 [Sycon ciliatum]|uniref:uncharacterized protein LOC135825355 n=1 Tax=Sycon ciliatum TaxID=27933 RepID=UPI0031F71361